VLTHLRPGRNDAGYSLVELLVVMIMMGLISIVTVTGIVQTGKTQKFVVDRSDSTAQLQKTIERMARDIRVADPVEVGTAGASTLQLRKFRAGSCSRIGYYISGTSLMQSTQRGLTPTPAPLGSPMVSDACNSNQSTTLPPTTGTVTVKTLATGLDTSTTLFTYYGIDGSTLGSTPTTTSIARILIKIKLSASPKQAVQTTVTLRNYKVPTS
jgi:type II secretory pathway pseudopilin PulG